MPVDGIDDDKCGVGNVAGNGQIGGELLLQVCPRGGAVAQNVASAAILVDLAKPIVPEAFEGNEKVPRE